MIDYGPPLLILHGNGVAIKSKRGGTGKISNSGTAPCRFHSPNKAPGGRGPSGPKAGIHGGKILPKPARGKVIWDPRDPFIIAYQLRKAL